MFIKIEAINIYNFIHAAANLNSIRGGGLMLLDMPARFGKEWTAQGPAQVITAGASKAVFRLQTSKTASEVEESALDWLRKEYPHATIGVAALDEGHEGFFTADEKLTAMIRERQMRSFSIAASPPVESGDVCEWDHVRPASRRIPARKNPFVSEPTAACYDYGRDKKSSFLNERAGIKSDFEYTWDMDQLSTWSAAGNLNHKVAVFYADGNQFGKLLRTQLEKSPVAEQEKLIRQFDDELKTRRTAFLSSVLQAAEAPRWQTADGKRRIEVLLWGGDELMLVVPAWCGWEVARLFCSSMRGALFQSGKVRIPMKHAMGLIFAHHKAPIHALTRLLDDLAQEAKEDRDNDRLSYLVLESFDHVGEDLRRFRELRCPDGGVRKAMVLSMEKDAPMEIEKLLKSLKDTEFPRRKSFQAVQGMARKIPWGELRREIEPFVGEWQTALDHWRKLTGGEQAAWYHLSELWDYVGLDL